MGGKKSILPLYLVDSLLLFLTFLDSHFDRICACIGLHLCVAINLLVYRHNEPFGEQDSIQTMARIFDNIENDLLGALRATLQVSKRSDFCVGYLNLRGWHAIDDLIDPWNPAEGQICRKPVMMIDLSPAQSTDRIAALLAAHESRTLDFNRIGGKHGRKCEAICAFANGVTRDGTTT